MVRTVLELPHTDDDPADPVALDHPDAAGPDTTAVVSSAAFSVAIFAIFFISFKYCGGGVLPVSSGSAAGSPVCTAAQACQLVE